VIGIREEVNEAFEKIYSEDPYDKHIEENNLSVALWAAKWMAERLRQEAHERDKQLMEYEIIQLAKELNHD